LSIVEFFLKPWANALELVEPRQEDYAWSMGRLNQGELHVH
jgi:hypothetical protein